MKSDMERLALFGGSKVIDAPLERYNSMGEEEVTAASAVVASGVLSKFIGGWEPDFYGGPKVQEFERQCEAYFNVRHAVTVNSWTSGLIAAVGAIGIEPGDEVIVSPWTMCASATAILQWNAIPVFADIETETFSLDPASIEANITPYTKAIMAVDIFGQSCDMEALMDIARRHNLKVICDTAQAPGALYNGAYAGTLSDVGGYSLNYHKHIHTGEGGILVTNDDTLAEKMRLIRNHAEGVVGGRGTNDLVNMVGFNFRLGEIECAIGIEQLKKLAGFVESRQVAADRLTAGLSGLKGLRTPVVRDGSTHVYYVYPMVLDIEALGVSRARIVEALEAEGLEGLAAGYANVHLLPMYQKKIAFGNSGFPWTSDICKRDVSYAKGICPVAEHLHDVSFLGFEMCLHRLTAQEVDRVVAVFQKVWANLDTLR
ncbi:DegT/DnrJ/EryC1/StrS family aminotransferase [Rhizobium sp. CNPSo 3490]|uniref:DegT/DnrJ/EryC1/StrS family aminotransferase n=1 Tax=Rhizobium sp. CNPSo 3490 TaxID=3021407 RepID=UPI00254F0F1F|nr:DegT/DnrJ/EryC1/StrS family aminotransferase [Rhizobium sp. CNPSo 3490]MDK4736459.1 DegT/DnrJ/EryC1/StrS family aminotransferase [Rhizobium sp. CNPSo 3490]